MQRRVTKMKSIRSLGALVVGSMMMAGCSSDPSQNATTTGSPDAGKDSPFSPLNGTITGDVTGTVTNGNIVIYRSDTTPPKHGLTINASVQAGALSFSVPRIPTGVVASGIYFTSTPVVGTFTNTDTAGVAAGDIGMNLEEEGDGARQYAAHPMGAQGALLGTWKVILTSVTPSAPMTSDPGSFIYYTVHGSIDATMPGNHVHKDMITTTPGTTSMHLDF